MIILFDNIIWLYLINNNNIINIIKFNNIIIKFWVFSITLFAGPNYFGLFFSIFNTGWIFSIFIRFQKGSIKNANKRFNPKGLYEITFEKTSIIEELVDEESNKIPTMQYNFRKIAEIANMNPGDVVDVYFNLFYK